MQRVRDHGWQLPDRIQGPGAQVPLRWFVEENQQDQLRLQSEIHQRLVQLRIGRQSRNALRCKYIFATIIWYV